MDWMKTPTWYNLLYLFWFFWLYVVLALYYCRWEFLCAMPKARSENQGNPNVDFLSRCHTESTHPEKADLDVKRRNKDHPFTVHLMQHYWESPALVLTLHRLVD